MYIYDLELLNEKIKNDATKYFSSKAYVSHVLTWNNTILGNSIF
jgi:hypothetical protein